MGRTTKPNQKPRKKRWPSTSTPSLLSARGAPLTIPSSATDGTTTGWSPAGTSTTNSRTSGACSTRRRPRWRRTTTGWRSGSTLRVQAGGVEGLRAIRKTSRGRKARGEEGGRQRLHPEELLKELHPAQG